MLTVLAAAAFAMPLPHLAEPPRRPLHPISRSSAELRARMKLINYGIDVALSDTFWAYDDLDVDSRLPSCAPANARHRTWRCAYRLTAKSAGVVVYRERGVVRVTSGSVLVAVS